MICFTGNQHSAASAQIKSCIAARTRCKEALSWLSQPVNLKPLQEAVTLKSLPTGLSACKPRHNRNFTFIVLCYSYCTVQCKHPKNVPYLQVAPALLQHPSTSVRAAAVDFVAAAASFLSPPDVYAHLLPLVIPAVTSEPASLTSQTAIVEQLPKQLQQGILERPGLGSSKAPSVALGSRRAPGSHAASETSVSSVSSLQKAARSPRAGRTLPAELHFCYAHTKANIG